MPNKELNSAIFTDLAQPSGRQGAEDEGGSCHMSHQGSAPEAGDLMIHERG